MTTSFDSSNPAGQTPSRPAPAATIYVVDDDLSFRQAIERVLRAGGYTVQAFASASELLRSPLPDVPGCLLLDLQLPELSGLDLQAQLAKLDTAHPVIFLTGKGDIASSVQAMRAGAEDFLTKPVRKQVLFAAVERALARNARERQRSARRRELATLFATLTPREKEVLNGVLRGQLNKQIALDLGSSERTVKLYRARCMAKLRVQSVAEAVLLAQEAGFVPAAHPAA